MTELPDKTANKAVGVLEFLGSHYSVEELAEILNIKHRLGELRRTNSFGALSGSAVSVLDKLHLDNGQNGESSSEQAIKNGTPQKAQQPAGFMLHSDPYKPKSLALAPPTGTANQSMPALTYDPDSPPPLEKCIKNRRIIYYGRTGWIRGYDLENPCQPKIHIEWVGEIRDVNQERHNHITLLVSR
jgi:hypothetical protein